MYLDVPIIAWYTYSFVHETAIVVGNHSMTPHFANKVAYVALYGQKKTIIIKYYC